MMPVMTAADAARCRSETPPKRTRNYGTWRAGDRALSAISCARARQFRRSFGLAAAGFRLGAIARGRLVPGVDLLGHRGLGASSGAVRARSCRSVATIVKVRRMVLAWKKAHRFEASICALSASVCALLPSVSENARNSASTAISSAIFLLSRPPSCAACCACSACSRFSCGPAMCCLPMSTAAARLQPQVAVRAARAEAGV